MGGGGGRWSESNRVLGNTNYHEFLGTPPFPRNSQFSESEARGNLRQATLKDNYSLTFMELKGIKRFHSRDQQLCKFIGTKGSVYIRKEINSNRYWFGTLTWPPFYCLGTSMWLP